jgi:predicted N-acetyltransferase YhbS
MDITIRSAISADVQKILYIIHEAFGQYKDNLLPPSGAHKETIQTIEEKLVEGGAYLAEIENNVVGCALWKSNDDYLYVGRLAVLPKYRKQGIGNKLMNIMEIKASELGYDEILIGVRISQSKLVKYYQNRGYGIIEYCFHEGYSNPTYVKMIKKM